MGRGAALGPVEMTGAGFWVSIPALGGAGCIPAKGTTKDTFCPCPWPGVLASICFENLRQVLNSSGLILLPLGSG